MESFLKDWPDALLSVFSSGRPLPSSGRQGANNNKKIRAIRLVNRLREVVGGIGDGDGSTTTGYVEGSSLQLRDWTAALYSSNVYPVNRRRSNNVYYDVGVNDENIFYLGTK